MGHNHSIYDTEPHFLIDPLTRTIKNQSEKFVIIQHDHNSERFTFEITRHIEGHDMSKCNRVEVHFVNDNASTRESVNGIYVVDDLQTSPDSEEVVIFSWLLSGHATQNAGNLSFVIRFACIGDDGETVEYAWHTSPYTKITILKGIYNTESIVEQYVDALAKMDSDIDKIEDTVNGLPVKKWVGTDENPVVLYSLESGMHLISGKMKTYPTAKVESVNGNFFIVERDPNSTVVYALKIVTATHGIGHYTISKTTAKYTNAKLGDILSRLTAAENNLGSYGSRLMEAESKLPAHGHTIHRTLPSVGLTGDIVLVDPSGKKNADTTEAWICLGGDTIHNDFIWKKLMFAD